MNKVIRIMDDTLCDGFSSAGLEINLDDKVQVAHQLAAAHVDVLEVGYPARSQVEFVTVQTIAEAIRGPVIAARARTQRNEIQRAWEALDGAEHPRIKLTIPTSPMFLQYTLRITEERACNQVADAVAYARSLGAEVQVTAEDASRSDWNFLARLFTVAVQAGAHVISVQDSVGRFTPKEFYDLVRHLRATVESIHQVHLGVDCRHDLGMALANALSAVECGIHQVECTLGGIGFPLGRVPLEAFVMALHSREDRYRVMTGLRPSDLHRLTALIPPLAQGSATPSKGLRDAAVSAIGDFATAETDAEHDPDPPLALQAFRIVVTDDGTCTAEITLGSGGQSIMSGTANARNQPEALHRAVNKAVNFGGILVEHVVNHVGPTHKEVLVCVEDKGRVALGMAAAHSVLHASVLAYVKAVCKLTGYR